MSGFSDLDLPAPVKAVSTTYQMSNTDFAVLATASSAYAVTLPPLAGVPSGHTVLVVKDSGANAITITASGTDKINNTASATQALASGGTNGHGATLVSAVSTWLLVGVV